ncbi:hypothetical protein MMC10_003336 [Thelotrema lepadinum]|nr:hypothetical protein [Thelotrema lepadinum]
MAELHSTYGSIVRVGPQHVMISDPAAVDIIHGFGSGFVKSPMYDVLELPVSGSGVHMLVTTQDGARHRLLRSQVASLFTEQGMLAFEDAVDDCVREFIQALRSRAIAPLDLSDWFQYYAGDVAARTTLGEAVGFLSHGEDIDDMVANLARGFHYAAIVGQVPDWHPYLIGNRRIMPILTKYLGFPDPTKPFLERIKLATYAHTRGAQVMGPTVLSFLLGHPSYCGESRDESDLIGQCFAFLAGGNSVALTLGSVFYYLLRYPSAYNSLRQELNQVGGQEQPRCAVKDAEIKYLPYLDACIIEALRLCPTSQIALERVVPEGGVAFQKHFLPSGTRVSIAPQCIHLNTQIYGTDAAEYRPERWIEASKAQRQVMERYFFAVCASRQSTWELFLLTRDNFSSRKEREPASAEDLP